MAKRIALTDAFVLAFAMVAGVTLRFGFGASTKAGAPLSINYPVFALVVAAVWWAFLLGCRTRDPRIVGDGVSEYGRVVRATVMMFGCLAIVSVLLKWEMSRGFLAISFPLGLLGLLFGRKWWRTWLNRQRRHGYNVSRVLVIGGPGAARRLAMKFNTNLETGARVSGVWVPDENHRFDPYLTAGGQKIPLLGSDHGVLDAIAVAGADTVIVTDSEHLGPDGMRELTWQLEGVDVDLMVSPNLVDISAPRMYLGQIADEPFIHLQEPQYAGAGNIVKGCFDSVLGVVATLAAAPVMLAAAVLIKATSPGPVLFKQKRIGRQGHPFTIYKLRTMVDGAHKEHSGLAAKATGRRGPLFKLECDPRVTPIGRFLRRYSLDELPQLVNVVRGDMSLVGPRPPLPAEVAAYDDRAHRRLTVRPGLTGLWQVSGRADLTWEETVRLDLYYVENWSMVGDLMILWRTVNAVIRGRGAY